MTIYYVCVCDRILYMHVHTFFIAVVSAAGVLVVGGRCATSVPRCSMPVVVWCDVSLHYTPGRVR